MAKTTTTKKKSSRKGTKAWRSNISTAEEDDFALQSARDERSGGSLAALPDETLFFVDKSSDLSLVKKTMKHREKVLHSDVILQRSSLVQPLLAPKKKLKKEKSILTKVQQCSNFLGTKKNAQSSYDIWGSEDKIDTRSTANKKTNKSVLAVEVDAPGCSYNPRFEDHQEALGLAVAQEMQKIYQKELEPKPIPRTLPGTIVDEEDMYFLEVGEDDTDDVSCGEEYNEVSRPIKVKKLTRADLNRKKRRKEKLRTEEESKKRARIQKDLTRLSEIEKAIEDEQLMKQREWLRRTVSRQEKHANGPPRLGKNRYQPEPLQVVLTDEITGSLRKLKGCYALVKERYNSLQKQGLIEPRLPAKKRGRKQRVEYEEGTRGQRERDMHYANLEGR